MKIHVFYSIKKFYDIKKSFTHDIRHRIIFFKINKDNNK